MLVIVFIVGACAGSFFNVVLSRLGREKGIISGRSHCPHCHRMLAWYELIPLFSFLVLRGKCRTCKEQISIRYLMVEVITALTAVIFVAQHGFSLSLESVFFAIFLGALLLLLFFDVLWYVLPDAVLMPMILITLVYQVIVKHSFFSALLTGFVLCALFAILYVVSRGTWVGFGDVKFVFLIGLAFGFPFGVLITLVAIWAATIVGILLLLVHRATIKTALPFGAFLAAASIIYILFAHEFEIFRWIVA